MAGIAATVFFINKLCEHYEICTGGIEFACDGLSALNRCFSYVSVIQVSEPDYDLLSFIQHLWKHSPIEWKVRHVKGHQDDFKSSNDIDRWGTLNIEMDSLAKGHISYAKTCPRHFALSYEPWSLWRNGEKIEKKLDQTLYELVHAHIAKDYWTSRGKISTDNIHQVHWDGIHHAMAEFSQARRTFITKHTTGMTGVGKFMKRWKQRASADCPRCGMMEDAAHVWICQGPGVKEAWSATLDGLAKWMDSVDTDPDISDAILHYLNSWRLDLDSSYVPPFFLREAIDQQKSMGWNLMLEGWMAAEWELVQQAYYTFLKSRRTGKRWLISIIKKLWQVAWDLWDHRNKVLHESENSVMQSHQRRLDHLVTDTYQRLSTYVIARSDQYLTRLPLPQLLVKECEYKKAWLMQADAALCITRRSQWRDRQPPHIMLRGMKQLLTRWLNSGRRSRSV
jgi:hypothetical protein